jgi:glycosyltransferase involved in cell wall biosynthesis
MFTLIRHISLSRKKKEMEYLSVPRLLALILRSLKYGKTRLPEVRIVRQAAPGEPLVSVIIATYNWSSVLRFAIRSVLWQTEQNFEVLVMGDGCTDDSEAVVSSFGDARLHWHNLPSNSGHQTAPNNAGLALARGRYIAYLGHDDVWHPRHLATLLQAIRRSRAQIATSLLEMIGPPGSNFRVIAGYYPRRGYDGKKGIPPSGIIHHREVVSRIGEWKHFSKVWRNPDVDFLYRAFEARLKFVSTRELTAFKFNSTLRPNSYVEKPCAEQSDYTDRIERRCWFLTEESMAIARLHLLRPKVTVPKIADPPTPDTPGWRVAQYRKLRGLE